MKNYISYLPNGMIIKTGSCPDNDFTLQGDLVIEGVADDSRQYIYNNLIVDMPTKPECECFFNFETKQWELDFLKQQEKINFKRNLMLLNSDWTQIPNNPLSVNQQELWATYRQQLRDITIQSGYPFNITWPIPPQ